MCSNYDSTRNKSIICHSHLQSLIDEFAFTGMKDSQRRTDSPGYRELINFGENIGFAIDECSFEKIPTTWGKIHYSKKGAHIVPYLPKD